MSTRRRQVIWIAYACCACAILAGFFVSQPARRPDIRLVFVGYTNVIIDARPGYTAWMTKALLEVTNCGAVPVKIASVRQAYPKPQIPVALAGSYLVMPTLQLSPGKMESVVTYLPSMESDGRLKVAYMRIGWIESLEDKARNSRNTIVQNLAKKLFPTAKLNWAQSDWITNSVQTIRLGAVGWVTNLPPSVLVSRYNITAPPPEIPIELLPKPKLR